MDMEGILDFTTPRKPTRTLQKPLEPTLKNLTILGPIVCYYKELQKIATLPSLKAGAGSATGRIK